MTRFRPSPRYRALRAIMALRHGGDYRAFRTACERPEIAQANLLQRILSANAETQFGARYGFARIDGPRAYRQAVPVRTYENLNEYIRIQETTGSPFLTAAPPVYYHRTSGTVKAAKYIPLTEAGLKRIREYQQLFAYAVARDSRAFSGKVLGITGQAVEGVMPGGTPYGSASGLLYRRMSGLVRKRYVLPPEVADITDHETRYLTIAAHALAERNVTAIGTANPSTLVRLLEVIRSETAMLIRAVHDGRLADAAGHAPTRKLPGNPGRARELEAVLAETGTLDYAAIWPRLDAVMTWTAGSCKVPLRRLKGSLPGLVSMIELGYLASECQGTLNVDASRNACVLNLKDVFFEFVAREARHNGGEEFLLAHELEAGRDYYVFITTGEGLYRYDMNDIVRVTGRFRQTPCLEFVQKGVGATSITGEKLYEDQVVGAVMQACAAADISPLFFIMLADQEAGGYRLYLEAGACGTWQSFRLAAEVDQGLRQANIEYDGKRASGRLAAVEIRWLRPGTGGLFRTARVAAGQRDTQFKYLHLQHTQDCLFDFDAHRETR